MDPGLPCALGTAVAYGAGSVLQAAAARAAPRVPALGPGLLLDLMRTWRYPAGLALDALGFALSVVALGSLPLYVVQSITASFLAVTALLAVPVLGLRLDLRDALAVLVVVVGLAVVGLSAAPQVATAPGRPVQWVVLALAVLLLAATRPLARSRAGSGAWALGAAAGLAFGIVAVAARALAASVPGTVFGPRFVDDVRMLVGAPAAYAIALAGPLALTAYAVALQRGSVVRATAPLVLGETLLPALAGVALLGDRSRPGWAVPAVIGFALAVIGAVGLARFGEVDPEVAPQSQADPRGHD